MMLHLCCDDFKEKFCQGFIWHEAEKKPDVSSYRLEPGGTEILNPTESACFRLKIMHAAYYRKDKDGNAEPVVWGTFLTYCPWCGIKLLEE